MAGFGQARQQNNKAANSKELHVLIDEAVRLHKAGQMDDAEALYLQALSRGFEHEIILSNLGVIYKRTNRIDQAIRIYERAIELNPEFADSHANLGGLLQEKGQYERAQQSLRKAIQLNPQHAVAHSNLGLALQAIGASEEATKSALESIRLNPGLASTYTNLAIVLKSQNQLEQASAAARKAIRLDSHYIPAYITLGTTYKELGLLDEALSVVLEAQKLKPDYAPSFISTGNILQEQGNLEEAIRATKHAIELDPSHPVAYVNLGVMLQGQDNLADAAAATQKAIELDANNAMAYRSLGSICRDKGDMKAAMAATLKSIELNPNDEVSYMNLGCIYAELCEHDQAEIYYRKAMEMDPCYIAAQVNLSQLQLLRHDYKNGWNNYNKRKEKSFISPNSDTGISIDIYQVNSSSNVLIAGEQGIGDQILFASLLPEMQLRCKRLFVTIDERLLPLFRRSFSGNIEFHPQDINLTDLPVDSFISMGDLGALLRQDKADFVTQPARYLTAEEQQTKIISEEIKGGKHKSILGLSWHSAGTRFFNRKKSLAMSKLAPMLAQLDAEIVKLQYGDCQDDITYAHDNHKLIIREIPNLDVTKNIDGLASLIAACDEIVTISNVTAHLSGALGKPTHLLAPASPHFYWGLDVPSTVWYPTVKIYRQRKDGDWNPALSELATALHH